MNTLIMGKRSLKFSNFPIGQNNFITCSQNSRYYFKHFALLCYTLNYLINKQDGISMQGGANHEKQMNQQDQIKNQVGAKI